MGQSTDGNQAGVGGQGGNTAGYNPEAYSSRDRSGTGTPSGQERYAQAKQTAAESFAQARRTITGVTRQAQQAASDWTAQTRSATEAYVLEKPWNALGIAAGIGLLIGLMLRR